MTLKRLLLTTTLSTLFLLSSCATSRHVQDQSYTILGEFAAQLPSVVAFDPYTATLHFDRNVVQNLFEATQLRLVNVGCGPVSPMFRGMPGESDFIAFNLKNYPMQNIAWKSDLYRQIVNNKQGWAIAQVEYPKMGLQHGDFTVKCLVMFHMSWCGGGGFSTGDYGFQPAFYFDVKSSALTSQASEKKVAAPEDSVTRLKKLKEMLDSGLINQQDYDAKKKAIIDGI
jgi:hypothetical protein